MKKTLITIFAFSLFQFGCSQKIEKPKITISAYNIQAITSKGVVDKILNETDYIKMHEIALAVESSRAVQCITVSEECNVLGEILNKIVNSTTESLPKESDNIAIYKLVARLTEEYSKGENKLRDQWKEYINAHAAETEAK
jgi:hypothetical protein